MRRHAVDRAYGSESFGIRAGLTVPDGGREAGVFVVSKWDREQTDWVARKLGGDRSGRRGFIQPGLADFIRWGVRPYAVSDPIPNLLTQVGWGRILTNALGAATAQGWDSTHTRIGVGTATAAATTGDTSLTATGTAASWSRVTGVGTTGTGTGTARLTFVSTFGTGDANFAWAEFATDQGTAAGVTTGAATAPLLNRAVSAQGTKASGQTWTATETLDFT